MNDDAINLVSLAEELEAFIQITVPGASPVLKYGGTLFTLHPEQKEGQFCGVFMYKQHVQLSFSKGAQLNDPLKLLSGSGKLRRHINLRSFDDVDCAGVEDLLVLASQL